MDTTLAVSGGRVAPKAAEGAVSFSDGGTGELVDSGQAGKTVSFGWAKSLPTPMLSGATATYPNVVPHGDLLLTATPTGFEVSLRLSQAPASALTLNLPVSYRGLTLSQDSTSKALSWTDGGGRQVSFANALEMFDATTNPISGNPQHLDAVPSALATVGGRQVLQLTADQAWLTDASLTYPVTIDPSTSFNVSMDTFVQSNIANTSQVGASMLSSGAQ